MVYSEVCGLSRERQKKQLLLSFSNLISQCFEHHKRNAFHLKCIGEAAEISETDISETHQIWKDLPV